MRSIARRLQRDTAAAVIVEYGLIVAGVSVATIGALWAVGDGLSGTFRTLTDFLSNAVK